MRLGIAQRLFLWVLAASGVTVACMLLIAHWTLNRGFLQYLSTLDRAKVEEVAGKLESLHDKAGTLSFLKERPRFWAAYLIRSQPGDEPPSRAMGEGRPFPHRQGPFGPGPGTNRPEARLVVLDGAGASLLGPSRGGEEVAFRAVAARGRVIAYVGFLPPRRFLESPQVRFLQQQTSALVLAAAGMGVLAAFFSLLLARRFVRPIRHLAEATRELATGRYDIRVPAASSDELGRLARDFNAMALALERNEALRRRWVADISHELRTPLAVLRGEIEALLEGIREITPERIGSLHAEVLRLTRLVDDLYQLSLSDVGALTYRKQELDLAELLDRSLSLLRPEFERKGIAVRAALGQGRECPVFGDPERLTQLFGNLFENSLKYTDPGGRLEVRLARDGGTATVELQDSSPGVSPVELGRLFERLYRAEASRNRGTGGAGLGLAICRSIVDAHEGAIEAAASPLGGLRVTVRLPMVEAEET